MLSWSLVKRILAPALSLALVTAGTACSDDDTADPPPPTTTAPKKTDRQQLEELAEGWFEAARAIGIESEPASKADDYLTNGYLDRFQREIERRSEQGVAVTPDPQDRSSNLVESVMVTGDQGIVVQCIVDADQLVRSADQSVIDDSVAAKRFRTDAVRTTSGWRFESRSAVEEWEGQTQCDEP